MNKKFTNYKEVLAKYEEEVSELNIYKARKKEITFIKENIASNTILLKGLRGTGKTTIVKEATKSLQEDWVKSKRVFWKRWFKKPKTFELDLTKISYDDILKNRIARYLNLRGKSTYLSTKESVYNTFKKCVFPVWAFVVPIIPLYFNYFSLAIEWIIAILSIAFGFPLFMIFVVAPVLRKIHKKKWKKKSKKIVLISEMNFLSREKMTRIWEMVARIIDVYKNNYLIFETSYLSSRYLEDKLEDKYEMRVLEVNNGRQYLRIFEMAINALNKWILKSENQGLKHLWEIESRSLGIRKFQFPSLINNLSFREIKILCRNIIYKYIALNGEINIWDYVNVFYLSRKNENLLSKLTMLDPTKTLDTGKLVEDLVKKGFIQEGDAHLKEIIINLYSFEENRVRDANNNLENREFLFSNTHYQQNYFDTVEDNPITSESLNVFLNNPIETALKMKRDEHNIGTLLIDTLSDTKCTKIIEKVINYNLENLEDEDKKLYWGQWWRNGNMQSIMKEIIDTRENVQQFYEKLSPQLKFALLYFYSIASGVNLEEVKQTIKENQFDTKWKDYVPKNIAWSPFLGPKENEIAICDYGEYVDFMLDKKLIDNLAIHITCKHYHKAIELFFIRHPLSEKMLEKFINILLEFDKEKDVFYKNENQEVIKWRTSKRTKLTAEDVKEEFDI